MCWYHSQTTQHIAIQKSKDFKMINRGNKRHFVVDKISNNKILGTKMKKHKRPLFTIDDAL